MPLTLEQELQWQDLKTEETELNELFLRAINRFIKKITNLRTFQVLITEKMTQYHNMPDDLKSVVDNEPVQRANIQRDYCDKFYEDIQLELEPLRSELQKVSSKLAALNALRRVK